MNYQCVLYQGESKSFPYRIIIRNNNKTIIDIRTKEKWPGPKGNIFCIRNNSEKNEVFKEIENVPIISLKRYGKKLIVILDRSINKRCEFIIIKKKYKNKEGEYEQIFWRTQKNLLLKGKNFKFYISKKTKKLKILIDKNEKYIWNFNCETKKVNLPIGDYALETDNGVIAVIERKTLENFIYELGNLQLLIQKLTELSKYKYSALVIEANYSDLLKERNYFSPSYFSKAIGNLQASLPSLPIIFAGSRKLAQNWAINYFQFVAQIETENSLFSDIEIEDKKLKNIEVSIEDKILAVNLNKFTLQEISKVLPSLNKSLLRNKLKNLVKEGRLIEEKKRK